MMMATRPLWRMTAAFVFSASLVGTVHPQWSTSDRPRPEPCWGVSSLSDIRQNLNSFWNVAVRLCGTGRADEELVATPRQAVVRVYVPWIDRLERQHGRAIVAGVLAHEWGHIVQRGGPGTAAELQADCLAGVFLKAHGFDWGAARRFADFSFDAGDPTWTSRGHGTSEQRQAAVLRGYAGFQGRLRTTTGPLCPFSAR